MNSARVRKGPLKVAAALLIVLPLCAAEHVFGADHLDPLVVPVAAPDFRLQDMEGRSHSLADHRDHVILMNFWASWCAPCVREMPSMQRLLDTLADRPFQVLAVNVAEPVQRLQSYLERQRLTFSVLLDPDSTAFYAWGVEVLPTSFLVDRQGRVRYRVAGEVDWGDPDVRATIERLLEETAQ